MSIFSHTPLFLFLLLILVVSRMNTATGKSSWDELNARLSVLELEDLVYPYDALEPYISERTMKIHHDKHHLKYITNAKAILDAAADSSYSSLTLEQIMAKAKSDNNVALLNNAAQSWNHAFYWLCLGPPYAIANQPKEDSGVYKQIIQDFGSFDDFKSKLSASVNSLFGSGWVWLSFNRDSRKLEICNTVNGDNPVLHGHGELDPLLTVDVWEHAYYLDYQNVRASYSTAVINDLINWDYVEFRFHKTLELIYVFDRDL